MAILIWLYRLLRHRSRSHRRRRSKHHRRYRSEAERATLYRAKAIPAIYFGLLVLLPGALVTLVYWWEFPAVAVLGMFAFVGGYATIMAGCRWWLNAKRCNEAIVIIGLLPVVILLIPFVRLIFLAAPDLLLLLPTMSSLILILVVWTLPDHSREHGVIAEPSREAWRVLNIPGGENNAHNGHGNLRGVVPKRDS